VTSADEATYTKPATGRILKRLIDIAIATFGLIIYSPLLLLVMIAIKLESPGPLFTLKQCRGLGGKPFSLFTFRSICVPQSVSRPRGSMVDRPMTHFGAVVRRSGIDRIPQLINVLRGEMSIVGPRPCALNEHAANLAIDGYRPGITGWAQVHGYAGERPTIDEIKRAYERDRWYAEHQSLSLDLTIIWRALKSGLEVQKRG
jgi:lipopolysaccharide/colanic/teichoic acid biosynthesis glycosyltransferase